MRKLNLENKKIKRFLVYFFILSIYLIISILNLEIFQWKIMEYNHWKNIFGEF
jgi:hypothetical protein